MKIRHMLAAASVIVATAGLSSGAEAQRWHHGYHHGWHHGYHRGWHRGYGYRHHWRYRHCRWHHRCW
jgi:hypothetical protein